MANKKVTSLSVKRDTSTERDVVATWSWGEKQTEGFTVRWFFYSKAGKVLVKDTEEIMDNSARMSRYTMSDDAGYVYCSVMPVSKTYKTTVNGNETEVKYWNGSWTDSNRYSDTESMPAKPSVPTTEITNSQIKASLNNLDLNADLIEFELYAIRNDTYDFVKKAQIPINNNSATVTFDVGYGYPYKIRCRSIRPMVYTKGSVSIVLNATYNYKNALFSEWSDYSDLIYTLPGKTSIEICKATSKTSVYLKWGIRIGTKTYDLQYADSNKFDIVDNVQTISNIENNIYEKTGLESGKTYWFRVRGVNSQGSGLWSDPVSVVIGSIPEPPTTYSSTTTAIVGEELNLYWIHNCEDGSTETQAELELVIDDVKQPVIVVEKEVVDENKEVISNYSIDTSSYTYGTKIKWRVRTAGITKEYGEWSIQRTVDVYATPTISISVTDSQGTLIDNLKYFPIVITSSTGPDTQNPIGFYVSITSKEEYETFDYAGDPKIVKVGDVVYSKNINTMKELDLEISAGDLYLENGITYVLNCTVTTNAGLKASVEKEIITEFGEDSFYADIEIGVNQDDDSAYLRPYCVNQSGDVSDGVLLSVYRRDFDGSLTEIAKDIDSSSNSYITDPHPALDYARYRVVAKSKETGVVSYYDPPGWPILETAVVIQWDEEWSSFEVINGDITTDNPHSGSLLKLLYNIDISDSNKSDVSLVEYIGRKHPVSYYGTQLGYSSNWSVDIPKSDKDTLYALRRLAAWMGDVYVREPSGSGYWANISVSFSQTHKELTIPVSLSITRVEGGM